MTDICEPPDIDFPDCTEDLQTEACDMAAWFISNTLLEAARCIIEAGPCPDAHKCDEDGLWLAGPEGEAIVNGQPDDDGCCCGSIIVGSTYNPSDVTDSDCYNPTDMDFYVQVSYDCETPAYLRSVERSRLNRLMTRVACCKMPDISIDPKLNKKYQLQLTDITDFYGDATRQQAAGCARSVFTFRVRL